MEYNLYKIEVFVFNYITLFIGNSPCHVASAVIHLDDPSWSSSRRHLYFLPHAFSSRQYDIYVYAYLTLIQEAIALSII